MADDASGKKRIHKMVVDEISMVKNPANEEPEYLMMKSMSEQDMSKAADAHKQLMTERLEALSQLSEDITKNAMEMDADELSTKLSQLNEISWGIRDIAYTVNIVKSGGTKMTDQNNPTSPSENTDEIQKKVGEINTLVAELVKAAGKKKDEEKDKMAADKPYGEYPEAGATLKKIAGLVGQLNKLVEGMMGKATTKTADGDAPEGDEDEVAKAKQLTAQRQAKLVEALKPVAELLKEVDPEFDLGTILNPPEPTEVEKAVQDSEKRIMDGVTKSLSEVLEPLKKKVEELSGAQGSSNAAPMDGDTPTETPMEKNIWGGSILK